MKHNKQNTERSDESSKSTKETPEKKIFEETINKKILPAIVGEALVAHKKTLEDERQNILEHADKEIQEFGVRK